MLSRRKFIALSGSYCLAVPFVGVLPSGMSSEVVVRRTLNPVSILRDTEIVQYGFYPHVFATPIRRYILRTPHRLPTTFSHKDDYYGFGLYASFQKENKETVWKQLKTMVEELCDCYDELRVVA